jgi:nucleotide sugar dehydrogenase
MTVGIVGFGTVGKAMVHTFMKKKVKCLFYDKFVECNSSLSELCEMCEIIFCALPTPFVTMQNTYDISAIHDTLSFLSDHDYCGIVIIKSTVLPGTTTILQSRYNNINLLHCPEFLSARTAQNDFENPRQIILGILSSTGNDVILFVTNFLRTVFPNVPIRICASGESECTKILCNAFYASKIQLFNEFYQYVGSMRGLDFDQVKKNMINQGWINPMHTSVPGHDNHISFGGACFPKDMRALLGHMKYRHTPHQVIEAVLCERDDMRKDENLIMPFPQISRATSANSQYLC